MIVEKHISAPKKSAAGRPPIYPLGEMEIGDSFRVSEEMCVNVRNCATLYGKRHNMKFTVRKYEEAYRCWRIS